MITFLSYPCIQFLSCHPECVPDSPLPRRLCCAEPQSCAPFPWPPTSPAASHFLQAGSPHLANSSIFFFSYKLNLSTLFLSKSSSGPPLYLKDNLNSSPCPSCPAWSDLCLPFQPHGSSSTLIPTDDSCLVLLCTQVPYSGFASNIPLQRNLPWPSSKVALPHITWSNHLVLFSS